VRALYLIALIGVVCAIFQLSAEQADTQAAPAHWTPWINAFLKNKINSIEIPNDRVHGLQLNVLQETNPNSSKHGLSVVWIAMPATEVGWRISEPRIVANVNATFEETAAAADIVVESGGYFGNKDDGSPIPLGLVIAAGELKNPKVRWQSGGVIVMKNGETKIMPIAAFTMNNAITEALQSKPIVVKNQAMDILSNQPDFYNRTAVGLDVGGGYVCVGAFAENGHAVTLFEFAELLCRLHDIGGPKLNDALALDGGPSSHLYIPSIHKHFGYAGDRYVPNVLRFCSKEHRQR
jgi:phosphodiester glycosidase